VNKWCRNNFKQYMCCVCVKYVNFFAWRGFKVYRQLWFKSNDFFDKKNHSIYISDLNHHDLNRPTLLLMHSPCFTVAIAWYLLKIMLKWKNCENLGRSVKLRKIVSLLSKKSQKLKTKSRILETSDTIRS